MPRLLTFAPCDNVLLGQDDSVSLIQIMNAIHISGDIPDPLPLKAATPVRWFLFSQWEVSPEEVGQEFEQDMRVERDDKILFRTSATFTGEAGKGIHRMIGGFSIFPIIPAGIYRLTLHIREVGENNPWQKVGDYPLEVIINHIPVPA